MSKISLSQVQHIANLSKLNLDESEEASMVTELNSIMQMINKLLTIDTDGVEPTEQVSGNTNVLRADVVQELPKPEDLMLASQNIQSNQFKVPKVL